MPRSVHKDIKSGKIKSWELQMDIEVLQSTNGTFFMALGPSPGAYSGIQQTPDTKWVPSGKLFIFSMWDTETGANNSILCWRAQQQRRYWREDRSNPQ